MRMRADVHTHARADPLSTVRCPIGQVRAHPDHGDPTHT
jgi:hypothetical protein